jgi:hypothetical protein
MITLLSNENAAVYISRLNLPALEATSVKSSPSVGLLELLAPCGGMPELQAPWEVALVDLQKCYIHYIVLSVYGKTKCCTSNYFFLISDLKLPGLDLL